MMNDDGSMRADVRGGSSYPCQQVCRIRFMHLDICKKPFACILQTCAKEIHITINNQKAVMVVLTDIYGNWGIL